MRKSAIQKQLEALRVQTAAMEADLASEQSLDVSASQADLNMVTERVDALAVQKTSILTFIDFNHNLLLEQINNQQNAIRESVEKMIDIFIAEERDRMKGLEARLRGMKGETNV